MNKIFTTLAIAIPLFLGSSASGNPSTPEIGRPAPELRLGGDDETSASSLRGRKVLINLWTRDNPSSRIANHRYSQMAAGRDDVVFVSICTDGDDERLSRYINYADGNDSGVMLYATSPGNTRGLEAYTAADDGMTTYLIDEYGTLRAASTPSRLIEI